MFMIGRQSGKKQVYYMMNGGQGPYESRPESATAAAMRIVNEEDRANKARQIPRTHVPYVSDNIAIHGMHAPTDAGRIYKKKGWFSWLGTDEGARG
tara:strand:+ start:706 stop:993 length:288 start_codon:yes stop_codon:yes gene_type:complete